LIRTTPSVCQRIHLSYCYSVIMFDNDYDKISDDSIMVDLGELPSVPQSGSSHIQTINVKELAFFTKENEVLSNDFDIEVIERFFDQHIFTSLDVVFVSIATDKKAVTKSLFNRLGRIRFKRLVIIESKIVSWKYLVMMKRIQELILISTKSEHKRIVVPARVKHLIVDNCILTIDTIHKMSGLTTVEINRSTINITLENFVNLRVYSSVNSNHSKAVIGECLNLIHLNLSGANLNEIDVSRCSELRELYLNQNRLVMLDVTHNRNLVVLQAVANKLDGIIGLEQIKTLEHVNVSENKLQYLMIREMAKLKYLNCLHNKIRSIGIKIDSTIDEIRHDKQVVVAIG
jgi:Leucine-rich repeat (LRR) protein